MWAKDIMEYPNGKRNGNRNQRDQYQPLFIFMFDF